MHRSSLVQTRALLTLIDTAYLMVLDKWPDFSLFFFEFLKSFIFTQFFTQYRYFSKTMSPNQQKYRFKRRIWSHDGTKNSVHLGKAIIILVHMAGTFCI